MRLLQVRGRPADEERPPEAPAKVQAPEGPEAPASQQAAEHPPIDVVLAARLAAAAPDHRQLGGVDSGVTRGIVAKPSEEDDAPASAHQTRGVERQPPGRQIGQGGEEPARAGPGAKSIRAERPQHRAEKERRERAAEPRSEEDEPTGARSRRHRQPALLHPRHVGKCAGFPRAEEKPRDEQGREAGGGSRKRGEERPRKHDARERRPRAEPIAEPAARELEERVREPKRAENQAHLPLAEPEVGLDVFLRPHDANAIEIREEGERAEERHHAVANARRTLGGGAQAGAA